VSPSSAQTRQECCLYGRARGNSGSHSQRLRVKAEDGNAGLLLEQNDCREAPTQFGMAASAGRSETTGRLMVGTGVGSGVWVGRSRGRRRLRYWRRRHRGGWKRWKGRQGGWIRPAVSGR